METASHWPRNVSLTQINILQQLLGENQLPVQGGLKKQTNKQEKAKQRLLWVECSVLCNYFPTNDADFMQRKGSETVPTGQGLFPSV